MGKICNNCGWDNTSNAVVCSKCGIHFKREAQEAKDSHESSAGTNLSQPCSFMWKVRGIVYRYAIISSICVIISTILLYSFFGPLTPNGNRYYHSFDLTTIPIWIVFLALLAMLTLQYPIYRFNKSDKPENHRYGLFPATKSIIAKLLSVSLTILNISTGFIFTTSFLLITCSYIFYNNRVMADDLETIMLAVAFILCSIFWGLIDLVYSIIYKHNW